MQIMLVHHSLRLEMGAVTDTAGNPVIGTTNATGDPAAIQVAMYVEDVIQPTLTCFSLDVNTGFMRLTFDDVVNQPRSCLRQ